MGQKIVTCPDTGSTECIEFDDHPLGALVTSCSRFDQGRGITCGRTCASKLDGQQRDPVDIDRDEGDTHVDIDRLIARLRIG